MDIEATLRPLLLPQPEGLPRFSQYLISVLNTSFRYYIVCVNLVRKRRRSGEMLVLPAAFCCFVLVIVMGYASDSTTSPGDGLTHKRDIQTGSTGKSGLAFSSVGGDALYFTDVSDDSARRLAPPTQELVTNSASVGSCC